MEGRRSSSRLKAQSFKSIFTNEMANPINLDDDDFVSPCPGSSVKIIEMGKVKAKEMGKKVVIDANEDKEKVSNGKNMVKGKGVVLDRKRKEKKEKGSKLKKKSKSTSNREGDETEFQKIASRMSPNSMYRAIQSLSDSQKMIVEGMGFGSILNLKMDSVPGTLCYFLVNNYSVATSSMKLANGEIKITKETVKCMLGFPSVEKDFSSMPDCDINNETYVAWKNQYVGEKFNSGTMLKRIRATDDADVNFKLNFVTLLLNTFADTEPSGSFKISFVRKLVNEEDWIGIDWCGYMIECLEKAKSKWRPNDRNSYFTGPLELLTLIYADRVVCKDVKIRRFRPFVCELDAEHLRNLEEYEVKNGKFGELTLREEVIDRNAKCFGTGTLEEFNAVLETGMVLVDNWKMKMKNNLIDGFFKFPEDETLIKWVSTLELLFSGEEFSNIGKAFGRKNNEGSIRNKGSVADDHNVHVDGNGDVGDLDGSEARRNKEAIESDRFIKSVLNSGGETSKDDKEKAADVEYGPIVLSPMNVEYATPEHNIPLWEGNGKGITPSILTPNFLRKCDEWEKSSIKKTLQYEDSVGGTKNNIEKDLGSKVVSSVEVYEDDDVSGNDSKKGKEVAVEPVLDGEQEKDVGGKRVIKKGKDLCSPYVERVCSVKDSATTGEQSVAKTILGAHLELSYIVWSSELYNLNLASAQTLLGGAKVDSHVIDSWSVLLTKSEKYKSSSSPSRMFFPTNMLVTSMVEEKKTLNFRYEEFHENIQGAITSITDVDDLHNFDMVFFPIIDGEKYYLICFNLKRCAFLIFDSKKCNGKVDRIYGKIPRVLHSFFCAYLFKTKHRKADSLRKKDPVMVEKKCQTDTYTPDAGIVLMRHMESYMGEGIAKWMCGLEGATRKQVPVMGRLRQKFMTKLIISDFNENREEFENEVARFAKEDKDQKK